MILIDGVPIEHLLLERVQLATRLWGPTLWAQKLLETVELVWGQVGGARVVLIQWSAMHYKVLNFFVFSEVTWRHLVRAALLKLLQSVLLVLGQVDDAWV